LKTNKPQKLKNFLNKEHFFYKVYQEPNQDKEQLKIGRKIILPLELDNGEQYLFLVNKTSEGKIIKRKLIPVRFVPLL